MITAIITFLSALLQAILEIFRATKKTPTQIKEISLDQLEAELKAAWASGDSIRITVATQALHDRVRREVR